MIDHRWSSSAQSSPFVRSTWGCVPMLPEPRAVPVAETPAEQRIAMVRSLLGHRKPSLHLCVLIGMAADGAGWDEIHAVDQAGRA